MEKIEEVRVQEATSDNNVESSNKKRHLTLVLIGHVDAGKSTIGGQILYLRGQVDDRTIEKYEKEAKSKGRDSWYMAYIMDTDGVERDKGKTVEYGRKYFETDTTRFTILDGPGHKQYLPYMIDGVSQADIAVLVVSARKGEFEPGFEEGQTREHVMLAKTLGVTRLLVVVNKMDDPTVNWSKQRFDEIESKMIPFLKSSKANYKDVLFLPVSGILGANIQVRVDKGLCSWWSGPCLIEALDVIQLPTQQGPDSDLRMPITNKSTNKGTVFIMGKIEAGSLRKGDSVTVMPNKVNVKVVGIYMDDDHQHTVEYAAQGEILWVGLEGIDKENISQGFVLSSTSNPIAVVNEFDALLQILELPESKIFNAGYHANLHIHSIAGEYCQVVELLQQIDIKTKKPMKKKPYFVRVGDVVVCRIQVNNMICIEKFSDLAQLGRFTLRSDEGKTVAAGKITHLPSVA